MFTRIRLFLLSVLCTFTIVHAQVPSKYAIKIGIASVGFPSISETDTTKLASMVKDVYAGYGNTFGLNAGFHGRINDKLSLGGEMFVTSGKNYFLNYGSFSLSANLKYNIISLTKHRVSPYIQMGIGINFVALEIRRLALKNLISANDTRLNKATFELLPAIGLDVRISKRTILFIELQHHNNLFSSIKTVLLGSSSNLVYNSISIGARFNLGKTKSEESSDTKPKTTKGEKSTIKFVLLDAELPILLDADIKNSDSITNPLNFKKERTGKYAVELQKGEIYTFIVRKKYYKPTSLKIDLTEENSSAEIEKTVSLEPLKKEFILNTFNPNNNEFIISDIDVVNLDMDEKLTPALRDNKHAINLREGSRYLVEVKSAKGFFFNTEIVDVNSITGINTNQINIAVKPINSGTTLQLKDILYKFNSEELLESSYKEIDRVIELMKVNPLLKIEIGAHTDESGTTEYNQKLSERRANFVTNYMITKGIATDRLKAKGYGKSKPIAANDTEENKARNRRVELVVVSNQ